MLYVDQTGDGDWEAHSSQISVNGKTTALLSSSRAIIFDTGTSNMLLDTNLTEVGCPSAFVPVTPTDRPHPLPPISSSPLQSVLIQAVYALISPDIKPFPAEPGAYGLPCAKVKDLPAEIAFAFTAQDGTPFNLTIPSAEFSVGPFADAPDTCQTLINAFDGINLLGGSLFKHYYSVWDVGRQRLGFAPNGGSGLSGSLFEGSIG